MKYQRVAIAIFTVACLGIYTNCSGSGFTSMNMGGVPGTGNSGSTGNIGGSGGIGGTTATPSTGSVSYQGKNVVPVTVGNCGYTNEPCVSVTICMPGTTNCQTINNILLDTGSYGLRVFGSVLTLPLPAVTDASGNPIAECLGYLGGSSDWGPVKRADIMLGAETASNVPMQIINSTFGTPPSTCMNLDSSPSTVGFNGILGVGLFTADCDNYCATTAANNFYYSCAGTTCTATTLAVANQVSNPISFMPQDNNGLFLQLPSVAANGMVSVSGAMVMGIGTQANNTNSAVQTFAADGYGNFKTVFNGKTIPTAFLDSGSNGLFFPATSALPACSASGIGNGFYCPTTLQSLTAQIQGASGSPSVTIPFSVMNGEAALASTNPNYAFADLGGAYTDGFDWGLPFFFGRTVFVGIQGRASNLGTGPFWAF